MAITNPAGIELKSRAEAPTTKVNPIPILSIRGGPTLRATNDYRHVRYFTKFYTTIAKLEQLIDAATPLGLLDFSSIQKVIIPGLVNVTKKPKYPQKSKHSAKLDSNVNP